MLPGVVMQRKQPLILTLRQALLLQRKGSNQFVTLQSDPIVQHAAPGKSQR